MEHPKLNLTIPWEEIELGAQQQIIKVLNMPELKQLAIMPDVHQGYDLPIGGVALLEGVVSPSFVGYDIGCVDKDTEVWVKGKGWVKFDALEHIEDPTIIQYNKDTGLLSFTSIIEYIKKPSEGFYNVKTTNGKFFSMWASKSHRHLFAEYYDDEPIDMTTEEIFFQPSITEDKVLTVPHPRGMVNTNPEIEYDENLLRLYVAAVTVKGTDIFSDDVEYSFSDMDQANRFERLLSMIDCGYVKIVTVPPLDDEFGIETVFKLSINPFLGEFNKKLNDVTARRLNVFFDELQFWSVDTYVEEDNQSNKFWNDDLPEGFADLIQLSWFASGEVLIQDNHFPGVFYPPNGYIFINKEKSPQLMPSEDGFEYCVKVPDGYFLARCDGKIFITGNCGMGHINTGMTVKELKLDTEKKKIKFFESLQNKVPAGVGKVRGTKDLKQFTSASNDKKFDEQINKLVYEQYGTLGSGNHFLELGANSKGEVGITVHSGSRRPGYDVASYYLRYGLLSIESAEGLAYLADMQWMLDFTLANRSQMLKDTLELLGLGYLSKKFLSQMINENHNHATRLIDGTVLHRKGATPADKDQLGIIPANQRDGVWITRGLGREEFLYSASHGAGRKMSRKQASQKGTTKELEKLMKGVVCRTDKDVLDEAPWAYKPIDVVLQAQDGILVDIIDHFKPIIVLKG